MPALELKRPKYRWGGQAGGSIPDCETGCLVVRIDNRRGRDVRPASSSIPASLAPDQHSGPSGPRADCRRLAGLGRPSAQVSARPWRRFDGRRRHHIPLPIPGRNAYGHVYDHGAKPWWCPRWLVDRVGIDYFDSVVQVVFANDTRSVTDDIVPSIASLDRLEWLALDAKGITNTGLEKLKNLTSLTRLALPMQRLATPGWPTCVVVSPGSPGPGLYRGWRCRAGASEGARETGVPSSRKDKGDRRRVAVLERPQPAGQPRPDRYGRHRSRCAKSEKDDAQCEDTQISAVGRAVKPDPWLARTTGRRTMPKG